MKPTSYFRRVLNTKQCGRKQRHGSRGKAEAALRSYAQAFPQKAKGMHAYLCDVCGGWHVGHKIGGGGKMKLDAYDVTIQLL